MSGPRRSTAQNRSSVVSRPSRSAPVPGRSNMDRETFGFPARPKVGRVAPRAPLQNLRECPGPRRSTPQVSHRSSVAKAGVRPSPGAATWIGETFGFLARPKVGRVAPRAPLQNLRECPGPRRSTPQVSHRSSVAKAGVRPSPGAATWIGETFGFLARPKVGRVAPRAPLQNLRECPGPRRSTPQVSHRSSVAKAGVRPSPGAATWIGETFGFLARPKAGRVAPRAPPKGACAEKARSCR